MNQSHWTDRDIRSASQDKLRFDHYCQLLSDIIGQADTPLTIGIFGPWGSGKSSLMRLIQEKLAQTEPPPLTVWFNAWKYDREEALWRALVIQALNAFRPPPPAPAPPADSSGDPAATQLAPAAPAEPQLAQADRALNQRLDELEASLYRTVEREEVGGVTIDWDKLLKGSIMGLTHLSLSALPGVGAVLSKMMEKAQEKISGEDVNAIFEAIQRERRKIYRQHIQSLEQFQQSFETLVKEEALDKERRLVVFIDDLDRCLPEKAIEVLEALKLFLDAPGCIFLLAADREVIQRGIRVKYKDFQIEADDPARPDRRIPISGDNYLEKIVQLPFHLLPLDESLVEAFIAKSGVELPAGCADILAAGLEANPRKVKRTLNIFRLLHQLGQLRQAEFKSDRGQIEINPQLLAKVVVIQSRYRQLYQDLVEYPALLPDLEERYLSGDIAAAPSAPASARAPEPAATETATSGPGLTLLERYQNLRPLQRLFARGDRFAGLPLEEVKLYLYLTYTTTESSAPPGAEQLLARWPDLLSNDLSIIRSALSAIQSEEEATIVRQRLLQILSSGDHPMERFSAGTALALLGDPRDFDEMIPIPAGDYPTGPAGEPQPIEGFNIGKYPVTNQQYQHFLEANPNQPPPGHWNQEERSYPSELANHPVVNVSWGEAQAYCRWAGKRLPSAAEWFAAARGPGGEPVSDVAGGYASGWSPGGTWPVGARPGQTAPTGAVDMVGNVWEWSASTKADGYALHGGATASPAPATAQTAAQPDTRRADIGFRVAE